MMKLNLYIKRVTLARIGPVVLLIMVAVKGESLRSKRYIELTMECACIYVCIIFIDDVFFSFTEEELMGPPRGRMLHIFLLKCCRRYLYLALILNVTE